MIALLQEWEERIDRALENRRWTKEDRIRILSVVAPTLEALLHDTVSNVESAVVTDILEDLEKQRVDIAPGYWQKRWRAALARHAMCKRAERDRLEKVLHRISRPAPPPRTNGSHP